MTSGQPGLPGLLSLTQGCWWPPPRAAVKVNETEKGQRLHTLEGGAGGGARPGRLLGACSSLARRKAAPEGSSSMSLQHPPSPMRRASLFIVPGTQVNPAESQALGEQGCQPG